MINGYEVIALIPARGGSKRLPGKNILPLCGKPLIAWTIEAAQKSRYIDRVVVNTDDEKTSHVALSCQAEVPFKRAKSLADDMSTTNEVVLDTISKLNLAGKKIILILLQPTSPLRTYTNIDEALQVLVEKNADGVVSVSECIHSPAWSNILPKNMSMECFLKEEFKNKRSQDLPVYFRINGAIYAFKVDSLLKNKGVFYSSSVYAYCMNEENSIDIDTQIDFDYAEFLLNRTEK